MPEISSGWYVHDFKAGRTAIVESSRCFVTDLNRNEIHPPRDFLEFITKSAKGEYQLDLDEIQHNMIITLPSLTQGYLLKNYGWFIDRACHDKTSYKLESASEEITFVQKLDDSIKVNIELARRKRSSTKVKTFKEISKFSINYRIVNYHDF